MFRDVTNFRNMNKISLVIVSLIKVISFDRVNHDSTNRYIWCFFCNICYQSLFFDSDLAFKNSWCKTIHKNNVYRISSLLVKSLIAQRVRIVSNVIQLYSLFHASWKHCINVIFNDYRYKFIEYDFDVKLLC